MTDGSIDWTDVGSSPSYDTGGGSSGSGFNWGSTFGGISSAVGGYFSSDAAKANAKANSKLSGTLVTVAVIVGVVVVLGIVLKGIFRKG